jgi:hypothetical protein
MGKGGERGEEEKAVQFDMGEEIDVCRDCLV